MKQTTKMSRAVSQLEHIYNSLNTDFFEGALPMPVITVQSKPGTFGHCTTGKIWKRKEDDTFELNIAAEVLSFPIEETIDTMLHEMVHLFCREHDIKETSRGGQYHNNKFREIAEAHGLTCYRTEKYGWNTRPGENLVEYALSKGWSEIQISRKTPLFMVGARCPGTVGGAVPSGPRRPSSTRKLVCPKCGQQARVTHARAYIICGDCLERMVEA